MSTAGWSGFIGRITVTPSIRIGGAFTRDSQWRRGRFGRILLIMRRWIDHIAMGVMLGNATLLARHLRVQDLLSVAQEFEPEGPPRMDPLRAERVCYRVSRLIPGASCLHHAVATKIWLSAHGVGAKIQIGFRMGAEFEGHAWLVLEDGTVLFDQGGDPYESIIGDP